MSNPEVDPFLPRVLRGPSNALPEKLAPLSMVHPVDGDLWLRVDGEGRLRLAQGWLLVLRGPAAATLERAPVARDVIVFRAGWPWVNATLGAIGVDPPADGPTVCIEPPGNDLARRATRLLCADSGPRAGGSEVAQRVEEAARWLELVSLAWAARADSPTRRRSPRGSRRGAFLAAVRRLGDEPLEGCSLAAFAERIGLSERHVSRLFRSELGTSFQEYVADLRVERAKQLLATTSLPITEVALESGWGSLSHFNTVFRRRTSLTPGAWRSTRQL